MSASRSAAYGQLNAFPELNGLYIEHDYDDETREQSRAVLEYLQSVEDERSTIPTLLVAARVNENSDQSDDVEYENWFGDSRGQLVDGVYVAAPSYGPELPHETKLISPQDAYRTRLISRFKSEQEILASGCPLLDAPNMPPFNAVSRSTWKTLIRTSEPNPLHIATLQVESVLVLLKHVTRLLHRNVNISANHSAWIWSLLAMVGGLGTLDNDGVYIVRQLGKRAVWVLCGFGPSHIAEATAQFGEDDALSITSSPRPSEGSNGVDHTATEEPNVINPSSDQTPDSNTSATLDMTITLVGECFGQRDLLQFREDWERGFSWALDEVPDQ